MEYLDVNALEFRRKGGFTRRYHGFRTLQDDSVGHHSFNVANILMAIVPPEITMERRALLMMAALDHDIAEWIVGDMPAPTKRAIPGLRDAFAEYEALVMGNAGVADASALLTDNEARLLKIADAADGMWFCIDERQMGNQKIIPIFGTFAAYVRDLLPDKDGPSARGTPEGQLYNYLWNLWEKCNGGYF